MKNKLAGFILMAGLSLSGAGVASAQVSFGIRIGPPPPMRVERVRPSMPGPGYQWVSGYWYPVNNRYVWHQGYWTRPPYQGATWIGPRYEGNQFYEGRWQANHQEYRHDHQSDRNRDRDYYRHDNGNHNGWDKDHDRDRDRDRR